MTTTVERIDAMALLLDLDGVLVCSEPSIERSWRCWAARRDLDTELVLRTCQGRRTVETIAMVAPGLDAAEEANRLEREQAADCHDVTACPGALALLSAIPGERWAVVTSGSRALAISRLTAAGLPVPSVLVAADDVQKGKPDPEGYLYAAARIGFPPRECIAIEDSRSGVLAARAAGLRTIGIAGRALESVSDLDAVVINLEAFEARFMRGRIRLLGRGASHVI